MNQNIPIDWSIARQTVQDDEELLRELVVTFLDEIPPTLQAMRTAVEAGEATALQRSAHTMKGALGHFGAQRAYEAALRVETRARAGDVAGAADGLPALEEAIAELKPILLKYVGRSGE
jgi:HPt (histidine-containing phosphotransfer) domain-containing protein